MNNELELLFKQAYQKQQDHQFEDAISLFIQALKINPQHQDSLHFLGLTYAQLGDMQQALYFLKQANEIKPAAHLLNNLANLYKKNNQADEAINFYLKAIALEPDYAQAHNNLANLYAQDNKYHAALNHYIKATHAAPDFSAAHFNLGLLLLKNNQLEAAEKQFNNVLALNPNALDASFYLGVLYLEKNALDEAEQAFLAVLGQDNEHVQTLVNLGVIALKKEQQQKAVDYFTQALALDNENVDARNNLAATFMHHDRFENALMHYDVLLQKEPHNIEYLYNSGVAQMALGHLNEATLFFEHIIQQCPNHTLALNNLAAIYLKLEMRETAKEYLERALAINPQDSISTHMLHALTGATPADSPREYAHNLFNNYALYYDQHMQGQLNYTIPQHIARIAHELHLLTLDKTLDLGCGTGLTGSVLRELSAQLVGVDIAEKMLAHAKQKNIYDQLIKMDILTFLRQDNALYDLIVAADVLPYFGNLDTLMHLISQHIAVEQYFIFTTEINEHHPWQLERSARFSHQPEYINALLNNCSLRLIRQEPIPARLQNHVPLQVMLYVAQKTTVSA